MGATFAALLTALASPIARQVMISLGLGVITFAGVDVAVNSILGQAKTAWAGSFTGDVAQLLAMAGANTALSIIAGAIIARVSMMVLKRIGVL